MGIHKMSGMAGSEKKVLPNPATPARARVRSAFQLARQEACYELHIMGYSHRRIAAELTAPPKGAEPRYTRLDRGTVARDIEAERKRRVEIAGEKADAYRADSVAFYEAIKQKAIEASDHSRWVSEGVKAQERIDRIRGIDQPIKLETGLERLWQKIDAGLLTLGDSR